MNIALKERQFIVDAGIRISDDANNLTKALKGIIKFKEPGENCHENTSKNGIY